MLKQSKIILIATNNTYHCIKSFDLAFRFLYLKKIYTMGK